MQIKIHDIEKSDESIAIDVERAQHTCGIEVRVEGHGDCSSVPGAGCPIYLERQGGKVKLYVWADINREDPTHVIDLDGAREDRRKD